MDTSIVLQPNESTNLKCGGIYQFRQLSTGRKYIGRARDFSRREKRHRRELSIGTHHNRCFQSAWSEYGSEDFTFEILEVICDESKLEIKEQWYLDNNIAWGFDFNSSRDSSYPPDSTGRKMPPRTPEMRANMSKAKKGKKLTEEHKKKISAAGKMRRATPETRVRMSAAQKAIGKTISPEHRAKVSEAQTGRKHTKEARAKMSESRKGKKKPPRTPETRENMSKAQIGKKMSPESRARMSIAQSARQARERADMDKKENR